MQNSSNSPLDGVTVLDLSRALAGPFCCMVLGDLGANVIKVEPVGEGDMIRKWGPHDRGVSAYYLSGNRNKRDIAVNFRSPEGLSLLLELALKSDVVVENFRTGVMEEMGLSFETLSSENPRIVYAGISGYGRTGPAANLPGFDQIAQGYSGLMSLTGSMESGPTRVGVAIGDQVAGMWTALGIVSALYERMSTNRGRRVETSLLGGLVGLLSVQGQRYLSLGEIPTPTGNSHPVISPYGAFATSNGPLNIAPATTEMWRRLCQVLELESLVNDARFIDNTARVENRTVLNALLEERLRLGTKETWSAKLTKAGIPAGPINSLADVFADPQVLHCGMIDEVPHPTLGSIRLIRSPISFDGAPGAIRRHPPLLGEHTLEVLEEFGLGEPRLSQLLEAGVIFQHSVN
jgi:crotonobetainyl-CoA:carnitine CoA-transferase CaiB-like acyl-CoA transferase